MARLEEERLELVQLKREFRQLRVSRLVPELNPPEAETMDGISRMAPAGHSVRVCDLLREIRMSPPMLSRMLGRLERKGYIERGLDPNDRRIAVVSMTEEGASVFEDCERRFATLLDAVIARMEPNEFHRLMEGMKHFAALMQEETERLLAEHEDDGVFGKEGA